MKFKPGDQVVCTKKDKWRPYNIGPSYNEVCTVERLSNISDNAIVLCEYPHITPNGGRHAYKWTWFEPLITDKELHEQLETIQELA